jgi:hypothetical protein
MADFSCASTKRSSHWPAPMVAALLLTSCNANQGVNLSSRTAPGVVAGPDYNPYDPISYAQNNAVNCAMTITPACPSRREPERS